MRRAWIVGCVLLLAACSRKVTVSAVDLSVEFKGYVPQCVRVTASDAEAPQEHTSSETLSRDKLASTDPNDDRTVRIAVYREESWSQRLLIEVTSFKDKCDGLVVETRKLEPVTLPAKGAEPRTIKLLAADGDNDGFFAKVDDSAIPVANDCDDQNLNRYPGAKAVCDGPGSFGVDFNCDGKSDCNGSTCSSDTQCGSGFCVDGVCCDNACNSPQTCRGTGVCNSAGNVGTCIYPVTPNVACSDGNGCTLNDKCDASGACVAGAPKTCNTAPGQCYGSAGTCKPLTGACEYPPLPNTTNCNDNNNCTTTDKCNGSGMCTGVAKVCNAAPNNQCYESSGTCNVTSGSCEYQPLSNTTVCDDGNKCTDTDKCNGSGTCAGSAKVCNSSPGQCYATAGTCNTGTGNCDYPPRSNTTACNDGKDCTSPDLCDGQGKCASTMNCPPPNECKVASTQVCTDTGVCQFVVAAGQVGKACTEGNKKGTCSPEGTCLRFNYAVTPNFNPETIAEGQTIDDMIVSCAATLDTSGANPTWSDSGCGFSKPTPVILSPTLLVIPVRNLTVDAPLRLVGTRSVIFAVYGNATLNEEIRANSVRTETLGGAGNGVECAGRVGSTGGENSGDGSGGGGGGLATAGGTGGANDDASMAGAGGGGTLSAGFYPLAGGCGGGNGGAPSGAATAGKGGAGGGGVQLSVAGTLTVRGVVSVSGAGGKGGGAAAGKTAGGGGGGSGGLLVLEAGALIIESTAKLTANGGAGGEGGSDASGLRTSGNDGLDGSRTGNSPASGGTDGSTGGGDGGAGAAGSAIPGNGSKGTSSGGGQAAGGGGGGAAGRILLRGVTSCSTIPPDSVISPAYDKTGGQCAAPALR